MKDRIKWFENEKGLGFIKYKSNGDVLIYCSSKHKGETIEFELIKTNEGYTINKKDWS